MSPTKESDFQPSGSSKILKPSPNEENAILKDALVERRRHRLLQVRMQEKRLAEKIRQAVRKKKDEELLALNECLKETWEKKIAAELEQLEKEYTDRLESIGQGHKASLEVPENNELILQQQATERALQRCKEAFQKVKEQKAAAMKAREEKSLLRESIAKLEQARASFMASKPAPKPDYIVDAQNKNRSCRSKTIDSFNTTRYHMAIAFAEKADSIQNINAMDAAKEFEEKLQHVDNALHKGDNERKEKSRLRHEFARQQVLLDQSKERLMLQLEDLEYKDRARRQQALQKIPVQVFQPPHQRLEDATAKQIALEEAFENAHRVGRVTQHAPLELDVDSEVPSINQSGSMVGNTSSVQLRPSPQGDITKGDIFVATDADVAIPASQQPDASTRMQKILGRIRTQQDDWAKRSVRNEANQTGPQDAEEYKQSVPTKTEFSEETTDSLVSADIESARCTHTNSDSINGDGAGNAIAVPETEDEKAQDDQMKDAQEDQIKDAQEDQDENERKDGLTPSEQDSLLHPFEQAKVIRSAKKPRINPMFPTDARNDPGDNVVSTTLENRKHTIKNRKHLLEIQKQRLANQILRRELKDTGTELGEFVEKDMLAGDTPRDGPSDRGAFVHGNATEIATQRLRSTKDAAFLGDYDPARVVAESLDLQHDTPSVSALEEKISDQLADETLVMGNSQQIDARDSVAKDKSRSHLQTVSADVSFISEIDSSRRADLAKKYPNIFKGLFAISDEGGHTTSAGENDVIVARDSSARYGQEAVVDKETKDDQASSQQGRTTVELQRIRSYQRQLLEKQKWLKSRQDIMQRRQNEQMKADDGKYPEHRDTGQKQEQLTRDLATKLSESRTFDRRREMYEDFPSSISSPSNELTQGNQTTSAVPRLDLQPLSDASSPTNSGVEADTESIDATLVTTKFDSKLKGVGVVRKVAAESEREMSSAKTVDNLSAQSATKSATKLQVRISEKPAFSPIQEVEERSFRNTQTSILSPGQGEVFKVSVGSGSSSSLVEQELPSARSSENLISPPPVSRTDHEKPNESVFSFKDLQSILSESDYLPLPRTKKPAPSMGQSRNILPHSITTDGKASEPLEMATASTNDWIRLEDHRDPALDKDINSSRYIQGLTAKGYENYTPFAVMSSEITDLNSKPDSNAKRISLGLPTADERFIIEPPGARQTNNPVLIIDTEPAYVPSVPVKNSSVDSMRETKPVYLEEFTRLTTSGNSSETSLTNLTRYEEILEKVRRMPFKQREEHNKLIESYQTWRKETVEPLIDPRNLYQMQNLDVSESGNASHIPDDYKASVSELLHDEPCEDNKDSGTIRGEVDLYQPALEGQNASLLHTAVEYKTTSGLQSSMRDILHVQESPSGDSTPFEALGSTREPVIRVYEPSLASRKESPGGEDAYSDKPGGFLLDLLMEQRRVSYSAGDNVARSSSVPFSPAETTGEPVFEDIRENMAQNTNVPLGFIERKGQRGFKDRDNDGVSVAKGRFESTAQDADKIPAVDIEALQAQYLENYSSKHLEPSFGRTTPGHSTTVHTTTSKDFFQSTGLRSDETVSELARLADIASSTSALSFPAVPTSSDDSDRKTLGSSVLKSTDFSSELSNLLSSASSLAGFESVKHAVEDLFANFRHFSSDSDADHADETSSISTSYFEPRRSLSSAPQSSEDSSVRTSGHSVERREPVMKLQQFSDVESTSTKLDSDADGFAVPPLPRFASTRLAAEAETASSTSPADASIVSDVKDLDLSLLSNLYFNQSENGRSETSWLLTRDDGARATIKEDQFQRTQSSTPNKSSTGTMKSLDQNTETSPSNSSKSDIFANSSSPNTNTESASENAPVLSWSDVLNQSSQATDVEQPEQDEENRPLDRREELFRKSQQRVQQLQRKQFDAASSSRGDATDKMKNKYSADGRFKKTRPDTIKRVSKENKRPRLDKDAITHRHSSKGGETKPKVSNEVKMSVKRGSKELAKQQMLQENRQRVKEFEKRVQTNLRNRRK